MFRSAHRRQTASSETQRRHVDQHLDALEGKLPDRFARWLVRLRQPGARWLRIPAGGLLICGGLLGFLPVLGFWMLPLGLLLLAIDVPFLERPTARALAWLAHCWQAGKARLQRSRQDPT